MSNNDLITVWNTIAREKTGYPDFYAWKFESVVGGLLVSGARCPNMITRGPRKGEPSIRNKLRGSELSVIVTKQDMDDYNRRHVTKCFLCDFKFGGYNTRRSSSRPDICQDCEGDTYND